MRQYIDSIKYVLENGEDVSDRTGVGTRSVFGYQTRYDLSEGFPAVTVKKLAWKAVVGELLWMLEGSTDERRLAELTFSKPREEIPEDKVTIWTANQKEQGGNLGFETEGLYRPLGAVYGENFRNFGSEYQASNGIDQIANVIRDIKNNPDSRRHIVSSWNPITMNNCALPPCHVLFQFRVMNNKLHCQLYQRSADVGLGVPFNIAFYSLMTHIFAKECGLDVGHFVHTIGDMHIYNDHIEPLKNIIDKEPYPLPTLVMDDINLMDCLEHGFEIEDAKKFRLENYQSHPTVKMSMAV